METITIRKIDGKWAGFSEKDKQVTKGACKGCVLKLLMKMTKNSNRYDRIVIYNEDGTQTIHSTGVTDAGNAEES